MPKKTGKGKKKVKKKKTKSPEISTEIGKVSNKTMVQQMASVSLSPTPTKKSTARERVSEVRCFSIFFPKNICKLLTCECYVMYLK